MLQDRIALRLNQCKTNNNTVKVYYNSILVLYIKGLVLKAVIAISIIFTTVSKWIKALLASFMLIKITLLSIRFLKIIK